MKSLTDCFTLNNGVKIPCIGFGTWQTQDGGAAVDAVRAALAAGYRHIDTAAAYGNEASVGRAVRESGIPREEVFVTSKLPNTAHGYETARAAFEATLNALGLDYLDLYLIHWPNPAGVRDHWAEANAEAWKAMEEFYRAGRIRAVGVSNFHARHLDALLDTAVVKPMVNQIRLCPGDTKDQVVKDSIERGLLPEAYSPLGGSVGMSGDANILKAPLVLELAGKYARSAAQICVRWCLQRGFLPLPKSTTPAHIASNGKVFDFEISGTDMEKLNKLSDYPDPFPHPDQTTW
jgi:diketogulonate reductase-like aldo/keto reductase